MFADLDQCIKCTACLSQCPVALVNPAFDGPKRLGPDRARLAGAAPAYRPASLKMCSNCRNCDMACPHGVNISRLINLARGENPPRRFRDRFLADVERAGKLVNMAPLNVLPALVAAAQPLQGLAGRLLGVSKAVGFFRGGGYGPGVFSRIRQKPSSKHVVYFPGCFASYFEPRVGLAAIRLLNHVGFRVELPRLSCCGLPFLANDFLKQARAKAVRNLDALSGAGLQDLDIVTTCPSCRLVLEKEYRDLFGLERADGVSGRVYDLFEFLDREGVDPAGSKPEGRFAYHAPCHLRAAGVGLPAYSMLTQRTGMEILDLDAGCCGMSGSYGFKAENHATAMAVGEGLFRAVFEARPDRVLTECGTCAIQITLGTGLPVQHPACLVAAMMGLDAG